MYLAATRTALMEAKADKLPTIRKQLLQCGGWLRKPAIATMSASDIIAKQQGGRGPIPSHACAHSPSHAIGTMIIHRA